MKRPMTNAMLVAASGLLYIALGILAVKKFHPRAGT